MKHPKPFQTLCVSLNEFAIFPQKRIGTCFIIFALLLTACSQSSSPILEGAAVTPQTPSPPTTVLKTILPTITATIIASTATPEPTAAITFTPTPPSSPTAEITSDPYSPYTIEALAARPYGGGQLQILETLEQTEKFARYLITYPSDGLEITGFMNVPHEGSNFPVVIMLHGYIAPFEYKTLDYTKRYADDLADAGFFVIHPNMRNFPPSSEGPDVFRTGMAIDVLNLVAIIREQSQDLQGPLRRANADDINLWGHSMGGGVALRVAVVNNAPYIKTAVLYGAMSGDERLNYGRILEWSAGERGMFELAAPAAAMEAISPIFHLDLLNAALSIHHGLGDETVPVEWSEDLCRKLETRNKESVCYFYENAPHTFNFPWDDVFKERVRSFLTEN